MLEGSMKRAGRHFVPSHGMSSSHADFRDASTNFLREKKEYRITLRKTLSQILERLAQTHNDNAAELDCQINTNKRLPA